MGVRSELEVIFTGSDRTMSSTASGIGSKFASLGAVVASGAAIAGAAVVGLGAAAIKLAKDTEPVAGITAAFEGLTAGMVGGSDAMLSALQENSNGFIANTQLMESFNKAAGLVSVEFAENLPAAMGPLGKIAAATGQDMSFMMDSLVTGIGRLSPMILDNLNVQVDLTEAYEEFAEANGLVATELTKTQQQAALMDQVLLKLNENTANMPDPAPGFASFGVAIQNVKDAIGSQLLPVLAPLMGRLTELINQYLPLVVAWMEVNLPIAIQKASDYWNNKLLPALTSAWEFIQTYIIPIFETLINVHMAAMEVRVAAVTAVWDGVLKPALQAVWQFLVVDMMPIWQALSELLGVAVPLVLTALQGIWQNVLLPALQTVWSFIQTKIIPIFDGMARGIGGVTGAISTVVGWIQTLTNKLSNIELPGWMTPGSPTPWQLGLEGVRREMEIMGRQTFPAFQVGLNNMNGSGGNRTTTVSNVWNVNTQAFNANSEGRAAMAFATGGI